MLFWLNFKPGSRGAAHAALRWNVKVVTMAKKISQHTGIYMFRSTLGFNIGPKERPNSNTTSIIVRKKIIKHNQIYLTW